MYKDIRNENKNTRIFKEPPRRYNMFVTMTSNYIFISLSMFHRLHFPGMIEQEGNEKDREIYLSLLQANVNMTGLLFSLGFYHAFIRYTAFNPVYMIYLSLLHSIPFLPSCQKTTGPWR